MSQPYIDFAFVKENASFERVLAHYSLDARGTGTQRSISCPFHRPDKRPSCRVELDRKIFHCFSCEASGNVLEFVARLAGAPDDLRAAAATVAEICEIPLAPPRQGRSKPAERPKTEQKGRGRGKPPSRPQSPPEAVSAAAGEPVNPPLTFALKLDPKHPYLVERGLSAGLVAGFGLGYCNRGVMAGRICIPIHNERGELVAYAGRWPGEAVPDGQERYRLPAKFEKSRVLFNLHRIQDADHVALVEGYWSVFRLHAMGVPVVGLMGWSVSPEQLALLRGRGTRYITVLWDGDEAGERARERALPDLASLFMVRAPRLPDGEKPDTLGEAELRQLVALP
jgi:DNA primase